MAGMDYRRLGNSGLLVSPICLGTMMFGGLTSDADARRIFAHAEAAGINFIDTADTYGKGESERVVGELVRDRRHAWVVATKAGSAAHAGPNGGGLSRKWLLHALDESLRRLRTDYVDIWYLHRDDFQTPLHEAVSAVGAAIASGKVRYWGFSNFSAWKAVEFVRLADSLGINRPIVAQPFYNLLNRTAETDYITACRHHGIGVIPYAALARGVLTGKYADRAAPPEGSRAARGDVRILEVELHPEALAVAQKLRAHLHEQGRELPQFAVSWLLHNAAVSSVLAGPRTLEQFPPYLDALSYAVSAGDEALVDSLVAPGHPATPGFTDPRYPVVGRFPRAEAG
jgi:aryl-alcohol dehydrogenase (NADP+)